MTEEKSIQRHVDEGTTLAAMFRRRLIVAGLVTVSLAVVVQFVQIRDLRMDSYDRRMLVSAQLSAEQVVQFVNDHRAALSLVAGHRVNDIRWPRRLAQLKSQFPAFATLLVADREGRIVYAHPQPGHGSTVSVVGRQIGDRPYFKIPMSTLQPYVSGVFRGRAFGADPIVAFSAPLMGASGEPEGIVEASITADQFARVHGAPLRQRGILFLVSDQHGTVVYSSDGLKPRSLERAALPTSDASVPRVDGLLIDGEMAYVGASTTPFGWTVNVVHPASISDSEARQDLLSMLGPAILALVVVVWVATVLARRLAAPIRDLSHRIKHHDVGGTTPEVVDSSAPRELRELSRAFSALTIRMNRAFAETKAATEALSRTVAERDEVIAERTAELRLANEELRSASRTDAMTGCRNYRGFIEDLGRMHRSCLEDAAPIAVVSCDIDHFKRYNDHYGHPAGDLCLRRVAGALRGAMASPSDLLARVGGEEFVAVLPRLSGTAAALVAERMRKAVAALAIEHINSDHCVVTVSVGWSVHSPGDVTTMENVLSRADSALYHSKQHGRNQVTGELGATDDL